MGTPLEPGPEEGSVLYVVLVGRIRTPLLQGLFLQYGNPAHIAQQEPEEERRHYAQVLGAAHDWRRWQKQTRPLEDLAKVVWVAAVGPQATLDELALVDEEDEWYAHIY